MEFHCEYVNFVDVSKKEKLNEKALLHVFIDALSRMEWKNFELNSNDDSAVVFSHFQTSLSFSY